MCFTLILIVMNITQHINWLMSLHIKISAFCGSGFGVYFIWYIKANSQQNMLCNFSFTATWHYCNKRNGDTSYLLYSTSSQRPYSSPLTSCYYVLRVLQCCNRHPIQLCCIISGPWVVRTMREQFHRKVSSTQIFNSIRWSLAIHILSTLKLRRPGADSIWRRCLISIGISTIRISLPHDRFIIQLGIPLPISIKISILKILLPHDCL